MNRRERRAARARGTPAAPRADVASALGDGVRHHQAGRLQPAQACYREALRLQPDNPDALNLLGVVHNQTGREAEAEALIARALAIGPTVALYHNNMGAALRALGRDDEAATHYREAARLDPGYVDAHVNLGNALDATGRLDDAIASYGRALDLAPDNADAHTALAGALAGVGDEDAAATHFHRAAELDPNSALAHGNLGNHLLRRGDTEAAIAAFTRATNLDPSHVEALVGLGAALRDAYRSAAAETHLRRALEIAPDHRHALHMLAMVMKDLGRRDEAERLLNHVLTIDAAFVEALNDLANLYKDDGRVDDAVRTFGRALDIEPDYDAARSNRSLLLLANGDFEQGWRDYMARGSVKARLGQIDREPVPDDLSGKRVLLLMDQGLGDEIFFLRFAAELRERGAEIAYLADPKIAAMVGRLEFIDLVVSDEGAAGAVDLTYSIGDLPGLLGLRSADRFSPPVMLAPLPELDDKYTAELAALGPAPRIGVTWRAGVQIRNRLSKIAPMDAIAAALKPMGATIVALQRNPAPGEIEAFGRAVGREIHDLTRLNDDLEAMLALVGHLDDYVCVSNTNVHLRASRGLACRVLVPHPPDYRWMSRGARTPWFPGTAVYRETAEGWAAALDELARDIAEAYPPGAA